MKAGQVQSAGRLRVVRNRRSSMLGQEAVSAGSGASSGNLRAVGSPESIHVKWTPVFLEATWLATLPAGLGVGNVGQQYSRGGCGVQVRSCCTRALARTRSFRITAVRATFGGFPLATSTSYFRFSAGLCWTATTAGMYSSLRTRCLPPWMKLRPLQCPDSRVTGASPARLAARGPVSVPSSGMWTISPAAVMSEMPRDRGQDLGPALQRLLLPEPPPDLCVDDLELPLDLPQPLLGDPLAHGSAQVPAAVGGGGPVLAQRVADLLKLGELSLSFRSRLGRTQILDGRRHHGQHSGVHRVGLGAPPDGAGEGPDLEGVDRVQGEPGLQEGVLEVAVEGSGGLVRDPVDPTADPSDQLVEAGAVVGEPACSPLAGGEGVEPVLGDVDPDGAEDFAHVFFPAPVLVVRASMLVYPFRTEGGTVATKLSDGPLRPSDDSIRPPSVAAQESAADAKE